MVESEHYTTLKHFLKMRVAIAVLIHTHRMGVRCNRVTRVWQ